jgi:hypothetical protein
MSLRGSRARRVRRRRTVDDPVRNAKYGCGCKGGGTVGDVGDGNWAFVSPPQMRQCWTASFLGAVYSFGIAHDNFKDAKDKICNGYGSFKGDLHEWVGDVGLICWKYKCKVGYFVANEDGSVDQAKCTPCNGLSDTVQGDTCWRVKCPDANSDIEAIKTGVLGKDLVIYNGKCMPVCDLQTAGQVYDDSDSTYISIKIKTKNAGAIGEKSN